ncbi:MAG: hypothetical protein MJK15_19170 [Colwellia sp.]|nr:hypothetical protein [Colwellia sp.]
MKKSIVATLIKTLAFTSVALCSVVNANESNESNISTAKASIEKASEDKIGIYIGLGGVFTNLDGYHGKGINISARVDMPLSIPENKWQRGIYGKVSYQMSHDENKNSNSYFDEIEIAIGFEGYINEAHKLFFELGDVKQNFEVDTTKIWQDYGTVYRIGYDAQHEYGTFNIALEHRDDRESATGYRTFLSTKGGLFSLSYTDVGDYEVIALNFNFSF